MSKWKKRLAGLLAAVMLVSLLPVTSLAGETLAVDTGMQMPGVKVEVPGWSPSTDSGGTSGESPSGGDDGIMPMSLLPLWEADDLYVRLDNMYFPGQMKAVPVKEVIAKINVELENYWDKRATAYIVDPDTDVQILWAKIDDMYGELSSDYTSATVNKDTMDLTTTGGSFAYLEIIVPKQGDKAEQLNPEMGRLRVRVDIQSISLSDMLAFEAAVSNDGVKEQLAITQDDYYDYYYLQVNGDKWQGGPLYLGMNFKSAASTDFKNALNGLTPHIYTGRYYNENDLKGAVEITKEIWGNIATTGGYWQELNYRNEAFYTLALTDDSTKEIVLIHPFYVRINANSKSLNPGYYPFEDDSGNYVTEYITSSSPASDCGHRSYQFTGYLQYGKSEEDPYKFTVRYYDGRSWEFFSPSVGKAFVGHYESLEEAEAAVEADADVEVTALGKGSNTRNYTVFSADLTEYTLIIVDANDEEIVFHIKGDTAPFEKPLTLYTNSFAGVSGYSYYDQEGSVSAAVDPGSVKDQHRIQMQMLFTMNEYNNYLQQLATASYGTDNQNGILYVERAVVGNYDTEEDIMDQPDIKSSLFGYGYSDTFDESKEFTVLDVFGEIHHMKATVIPRDMYLDINYIRRADDGSYVLSGIELKGSEYDKAYTCEIVAGNFAGDPYKLILNLYYYYSYYINGDGNGYYRSISVNSRNLETYVKAAVKGRYTSEKDINAQPDVKEELFISGYEANYKNGVDFTILDSNGQIHNINVKLVEGPEEYSGDYYFQVTGASSGSDRDGTTNPYNDGVYQTWIMPGNVDAYYLGNGRDLDDYGFQTVLMLKENGYEGSPAVPVTDTTITPSFWTGDGVTMYAGHSGNSGSEQESRVTSIQNITLDGTKTVQYTAVSEKASSGDNKLNYMKNYWVTFITQQKGAKLFVNAANEEFETRTGLDNLYDKTENAYIREVYLNDKNNYHHDIFIANIGDEPLTDIKVTLSSDAKNIKLDDYWTVGEKYKELAPFTTVIEEKAYGLLPNVAKIRLVLNETGNKVDIGAISGTLTIEAMEGTEKVTKKIKLTGYAGPTEIATEYLNYGVLYVPYEQIIQTNAMGVTTGVTFSYTGRLPQGLELNRTTGVIYGVPKEKGDFPITVTATFADGAVSNSKEYTLSIVDNTDENVWTYEADIWNYYDYNSSDYRITIAIPNEDNVTVSAPSDAIYTTSSNNWSNDKLIFETLGRYSYFEFKVYLDGVELKETEYESEEGSTRITIQTQTLTKVSNNKPHTIAAEFRDGATNDLHRAAQNYTLTSKGTGSGSSGGNYGGGSGSGSGSGSSSNKPNDSQTPDTPSQPSTPDPATGLPFVDVQSNDWSLPFIKDMYDRGLMVGTSENDFSPNLAMSRAMIVTVLYRLAGEPEVEGESNFADVPQDSWYTRAAAWAMENGIIVGYGDGVFGPDDDVSREQLIMILMRYAAMIGLDTSVRADLTVFSDSGEIYPEFVEATAWAVAVELIHGYEDGTLRPQGFGTRAEVATMLSLFCAMLEAEA